MENDKRPNLIGYDGNVEMDRFPGRKFSGPADRFRNAN